VKESARTHPQVREELASSGECLAEVGETENSSKKRERIAPGRPEAPRMCQINER